MTAVLDLREFPPVEENIERPQTLSQSLLARHDKCPRSAYLGRKFKTASHPMDRGSAFHAVPERGIETLIDQGETRMPGEVARDLAEVVMDEHTEWVLPAEEQDAVRGMAWNWGEAFTLDLNTYLGAEVPMEIEIGGWRVTCRLDLIDVVGGAIHITDYKTSLNIRRREEVQRGFQGKLYALAALFGVRQDTGLSLGTGINEVWFWETYPRYRDENGGLVAKEGSWTRSEIYEFKTSLERNIARFEASLETGDWPARDGSWCSECPAQSECPIPAHLREVEEITTLADAEDAFSHWFALDREKARLQAGLRGWVRENGPVYLGDYAFDATTSESRSIKDWPTLLAAIRRASEFGVPFVENHHLDIRTSTKFGKRKMTEEERDARA